MNTEKPCLVSVKCTSSEKNTSNTSQGFSILNTVEYKNRFLYSKYNPIKTVLSSVNNLTILSGTLVIICSPCLFYGLEELLFKLPDNCLILAVENDIQLLSLANEYLNKCISSLPNINKTKIKLIKIDTLLPEEKNKIFSLYAEQADSFITEADSRNFIRRVQRIDFSAGVQFASSSYETFCNAAEKIIAQFWKNRITLTKLGRLYARNIFRNLISLTKEQEFSQVKKTIDKPIIVCGAGESLNDTLEKLCSNKNFNKQDFYFLVVDAALSVFSTYEIKPDSIIGMESQFAIQKAYIGAKDTKIPLFLDITSRPQIKDIVNGKVIWFTTKYTDCEFLKNLYNSGIIFEYVPALGSVGLTAVYLALQLRANENIPIYVSGLDFSYSCGATHAKATPAYYQRLMSCTRFQPVENYEASFKTGSNIIMSKNNQLIRTDTIMSLYAQNFIEEFSSQKNLFDIGNTGINIGLPRINIQTILDNKNLKKDNLKAKNLYTNLTPCNDKTFTKKIIDFYQDELLALTTIKDLLIQGENSKYRNRTISLNEQLNTIIKKRDYLYLHFPDGYKYSDAVNFLKRIRAELDLFIKDINFALSQNKKL